MIAPYPRLGVRHGGNSGVASYAANLGRALVDAGSAVTVIAPHEPGQPRTGRDGDVRVHRAFRPGLRAMPAALAAARETQASVIHLQFELFLFGGMAALPGVVAGLRTGRRRAARQVVTMHQVVDPARVDADFTGLHRLPVRPAAARTGIGAVQRTIGALADVVIVHEPAFAAVMPGAVTVPHGVERVNAADRERARASLGVDDRFLALCFGFLAPYKGLELAGEAARLAGGDIHLVIAGGEHPRLEGRYGYGAGLRQAYGDVATFPGFVPDADVHRWFQAADVILLPYPAPHASSGALALALAHGKPVLASGPLARTCGLPAEVVADDPETLAQKLLRLASDPAAPIRLAAATSSLGSDRSWGDVARRHIEIYRAATAA
jgi:glycosyltransferase involved in cell wall biosynthesis